jgi:hypothetical protein
MTIASNTYDRSCLPRRRKTTENASPCEGSTGDARVIVHSGSNPSFPVPNGINLDILRLLVIDWEPD